MAVSQIKMPQLGEPVTEGTVDKWLKHEGDFVKRDEPLVEVITDKVNAEIPSPFEGKLVKITAAQGETVQVGAVIAQIETAGAASGKSEPAAKQPQAAAVSEGAAEAPGPAVDRRAHGAQPGHVPTRMDAAGSRRHQPGSLPGVGKGGLQGPPQRRADLPPLRRADRGRCSQGVSLAQLLVVRRGRHPQALRQ